MGKILAIFGAGGHGRVAADCAQLSAKWEDIVVFDDKLGDGKTFEDFLSLSPINYDAFIAIGNNKTREKLCQKTSLAGLKLAVIRHPSSIVAYDVILGDGTLLVAGTVINPGTKIGLACIINTAASVDHDCVIGDFVHIAPGAHLAGTVNVGDNSWVGLNACVCENLNIGNNVMVAAGAVVTKNIDSDKTVMGVPAQ